MIQPDAKACPRHGEQFRKLRLKVTQLPAEKRELFLTAIAEAESQQHRLDRANAEICSLVQDLSLIVTTTQFNAWAAGLIR